MPLALKVTIARIISVPFFIAAILYYSPERDYLRYVALAIFSFAVISDVIDGYIARTRKQKTRAGAILDPLADKILLISAFICIFKMAELFAVKFPMWLVVGVISRDVIILLGAMIIQSISGDFKVEASFWGKATTFSQVLCIAGALLEWSFSPYFWYLAIALTAISGIDYILTGIKILNNPKQLEGA